MDNLYGNNPRIGKILAVHGALPVITGVCNHPSIERGCLKPLAKTSTVDPYSSRYNNLIKLLQPNSSPPVLDNFGPTSRLKLMEEETLVIDGIPVESSCGSSLAYGDSRRMVHWALEDNISTFPSSKSRVSASVSCVLSFQLRKALISFSAAKKIFFWRWGFYAFSYLQSFTRVWNFRT